MSARIEVARSVRARVPSGVLRRLEQRLRRASTRVQPDPSLEYTIRICDDDEIAALHLRHMGLRGPTDVLSFPAEAPLPDMQVELGDIAISWDAVLRQSPGSGRAAWLEELTQLAIHGLAHLLGHDHATRAEGRAMLRTERRAARAAGAGAVARPYG